jgi:EAL domain-containing protein (putative c-di-GMP-specific phosphodiesterase class I)/CheY-like chemotaxis protein
MSVTSAPSPPENADGAAPAIEAPPLAPGDAPLCYVADEDASIRHFLSLILHGVGVDTMEFSDGAALRQAIATRVPALVFHNISLESADAIESLVTLGKQGYRGAIQLMSNRGAAVLEHVKSTGIHHKLNMLPVLKKPFETEAILKILSELKLGITATVASRIDLKEALSNNWIEFWYQPKIDLRKKRLAGAEAYARARHPQHGIVMPDAFMPGATEANLTKLSEQALTSALKASTAFSNLGVNLPLTVNIPVPVLVKLPLEAIVKTHRPDGDKWAGLMIDVNEEEIIGDLPLAAELAKKFEPLNVRLAIDKFGHGHAQLAKLDQLPFAELKLDHAFVTDCSVDKVNAPLCRTVIDLAHHFRRTAMAMGIEKASDAIALASMGCDFGQGFLFGQPMPEQRFVSLLHQRAATQGRQLAATP